MKNKAKVCAMIYELCMLSGECGHNASFDVSSTSQKRPHTTPPTLCTKLIPFRGLAFMEEGSAPRSNNYRGESKRACK